MDLKQVLVHTAVVILARQGFKGKASFEIAKAAGVTEPATLYHFQKKDGLLTHIFDDIDKEYFNRLDTLEHDSQTQFERLNNLIEFHFTFVNDIPTEPTTLDCICCRLDSDRNRMQREIAGHGAGQG